MEKRDRETELNTVNRRIAEVIRPMLPAGAGFALLVFDMGPDGFMTWVSNAKRADMVKALRELANVLEGGGAA
jgi:hypothetical protein